MRPHRFLVEEPLVDASIRITDQDILHQWLRVLRYTGGEDVILLDGKGLEIVGVLERLSKEEAIVRVRDRVTSAAPTSPKFTLCFSPLKREFTELVFQKGTELGVDVFQPIICERTIKDRINQERLERIIKEATEQSGRVWIPDIRPLADLETAMQVVSKETAFFASLSVQDKHDFVQVNPSKPLSLFIGPEGGWTEHEERMALERQLIPLRLSAHVLRAETACIAGAALLCASIA